MIRDRTAEPGKAPPDCRPRTSTSQHPHRNRPAGFPAGEAITDVWCGVGDSPVCARRLETELRTRPGRTRADGAHMCRNA